MKYLALVFILFPFFSCHSQDDEFDTNLDDYGELSSELKLDTIIVSSNDTTYFDSTGSLKKGLEISVYLIVKSYNVRLHEAKSNEGKVINGLKERRWLDYGFTSEEKGEIYIADESFYVNGVRHGYSIGYQENGSKTRIGYFKNGKKDGEWYYFDLDSSEVVLLRKYNNGTLLFEKHLNEYNASSSYRFDFDY